MDVTKALGLFRDLLNSSWPTVLAFEEQYEDCSFNEFRMNWLQTNWEQTVEQSILQGPWFLDVYGEGAEFGGKSSRVFRSDALPSHQILCQPLQDGILLSGNLTSSGSVSISTDMIFDCFVTMTETGWFEESPPFDCVIANHGSSQVLFKYEGAEFSVEKIKQSLRKG